MKKRFYLIDGIRGLAIVNMVLFHFLYDVFILYGRQPDWYARTGTLFLAAGDLLDLYSDFRYGLAAGTEGEPETGPSPEFLGAGDLGGHLRCGTPGSCLVRHPEFYRLRCASDAASGSGLLQNSAGSGHPREHAFTFFCSGTYSRECSVWPRIRWRFFRTGCISQSF